MAGVLDQITKPNDIKDIPKTQYRRLAREIRHFLLHRVSEQGGHLASNLGAVELTMALHLFLDFPEDRLIWDVGHQAYVHKLLTGRKKEFFTLREYQGMSGFPKRKESDCDAFDTGHSSTSLSIAAGMVSARELSGADRKIVAVIGDGALTGGMAFEALNNMGKLDSNLIIILNDNNMSISENVGGLSNYLGKIRTNSAYTGFKSGLEEALNKLPDGNKIVKTLKHSKDSIKHLMIGGMLFEDMGITYIGPIDGHDIEQITKALHSAAKLDKAVLIHVITKKGRGYGPAEANPGRFHGVEPFALKTGETLHKKQGVTYTETFSETMLKLGALHENVIAVTAAMPTGTGLDAFAARYPERFFDVGIAEEHAVTFAAGMAAEGYHPVVAVYSTFLQRAYDQILHDVCINDLPVIFAVDRAGIVGRDGETHQGIFDLSYLAHIPNLTVMAPKNTAELKKMLQFAADYPHPVAIRYPRGTDSVEKELPAEEIRLGKMEIIREAAYGRKRVAIVSLGNTADLAILLESMLNEEGIDVSLCNARFAAPLDDALLEVAVEHDVILTLEENVARGGFGEQIAVLMKENNISTPLVIGALDNRFMEHGNPEILRKQYGLDEDMLLARVLAALKIS